MYMCTVLSIVCTSSVKYQGFAISGTSGKIKNPLIATGREITPSITKSLTCLDDAEFTTDIDLPLPAFEAVTPAESVHGVHEVARKHAGDAAASVKNA